MSTILVTGPHGFVGTHLVRRLTALGHTVVGIGRGDDLPDCTKLVTYDAVINCAGELDIVDRMVDSNLTWVANLLENLRRCAFKGRVIQVGSSAETGPVVGPRSETTFCDPSNLYEATKLAATNLCLGYARQYSLNVVVARPFSLFGPGDKRRKLLPALWLAWKADAEFTCHPGVHDWLYVDDFIDGLLKLLAAPRPLTVGQVYHFGTGIGTSNRRIVELFNHFAGGAGVRVKYVSGFLHSHDVPDWRADTGHTSDYLGWVARTSLEDGIRECVMSSWFEEDRAPGL